MCQFRKLQGAGRGGRREAQRQREGTQGPLTPAVSFQNTGTYPVWGRVQDMGMFRESPLAGLRKATPQLWPQERGGVSKGTFKPPPGTPSAAPVLQGSETLPAHPGPSLAGPCTKVRGEPLLSRALRQAVHEHACECRELLHSGAPGLLGAGV